MTYVKYLLYILCLGLGYGALAQIDVQHVLSIGRNALYFNDYVVSIGYFNRVIDTRPWLAEAYLYRAIAKISLDDLHGANQDASLCIERNPYISRAYLIRGIALQSLERHSEAIADYQYGLSLSPDNGQMRFNLAIAQFKEKNYDIAEHNLDTLLHYHAQYPEAHSLRANIALEKQDTTLALRHIAEAIRQHPRLSSPHRLQAHIAIAQERWHQGIESLTQAIDIDGEQADLYADRAMMYYYANKLKEALKDYSRALEINPKHRISLNNRAILLQQVGEKALAVRDWERILALEPNNHIARYNRAILNTDLNEDLEQALRDLNLILEYYPSFADGFIQRSLLKQRLGYKQEASKDYWHATQLLQDKKLSTQALVQARKNKQTKDEHDHSIDRYAQLIETKTMSLPETRYKSRERGRVQDRNVAIAGRPIYYLSFFSPGAKETNTVNNLRPYSSFVLPQNFGTDSLILHTQAEEMSLDSLHIKRLEQILSKQEQKGDATYYLQRGIAYSLLQDYEQAILDYNRALSIDRRYSLALFARSIASMRLKEVQRELETTQSSILGKQLDLSPNVLQDLAQLLMLAPDFAYGYYNRAILYAQQGQNTLAIEDYNKAIELQPQLAEAYFNRALLHLASGQRDKASFDLSKAGELGLYQAYNIIKRIK